MTNRTASERITDEVGAWPGVEVDTGELGEVAFSLGGREIGHVHGDHAAHFSFPRPVWDELRAEGRIEATATTPWIGFKDDVVIRVVGAGTETRVDLRSKSRVGRGDAGMNAKRIRAFRDRLMAS